MGFPYLHNQSCKSKIIIYQSITLFVYEFICETVSDKAHTHMYIKVTYTILLCYKHIILFDALKCVYPNSFCVQIKFTNARRLQ